MIYVEQNRLLTCLFQTGHLIYQCGGIDKRTIEKFEKASTHFQLCSAISCPSSP